MLIEIAARDAPLIFGSASSASLYLLARENRAERRRKMKRSSPRDSGLHDYNLHRYLTY